jgi:fructokinase
MGKKIACIGEILWDSMPSGLFLGGAPYNVAYHLTRLGNDVSFISRVGKDRLGREAIIRVKNAGLSTDYIQIDPELNTGFVDVTLGGQGIPEYQIIKPVAWDEIALTGKAKKVMESADALVFGTLAQRSKRSGKTIEWAENSKGIKFLDLNFRFPFVDADIAERSLKIADVLKLNDDELKVLQEWYKLPRNIKESMEWMADQYSLQSICLTKGREGALLWSEGKFIESDGIRVKVNDTVGSGDAFLAAFITGHLVNIASDQLLSLSNRLGAYVATRSGGTPDYSIESYTEISMLPLTANPE